MLCSPVAVCTVRRVVGMYVSWHCIFRCTCEHSTVCCSTSYTTTFSFIFVFLVPLAWVFTINQNKMPLYANPIHRQLNSTIVLGLTTSFLPRDWLPALFSAFTYVNLIIMLLSPSLGYLSFSELFLFSFSPFLPFFVLLFSLCN